MSTKTLKMTARNIFDIKWNYRVLQKLTWHSIILEWIWLQMVCEKNSGSMDTINLLN